MLETHLKVFRPRKLTDINRNDVARLHGKIREIAQYRANRVVALLRKMFNLARDWGYIKVRIPRHGSYSFERNPAIALFSQRNSLGFSQP